MDSAIILAAGLGSRLSHFLPKPLAKLETGETILSRQIRCLSGVVEPLRVIAVVGHKKEAIMEAQPQLTYVYNEQFDCTNTSKSLLRGLERTQGNTMWLNGDVVLDERVAKRVRKAIHRAKDPAVAVAVVYREVGDEEVTFLEEGDRITAIAKAIKGGLGEAVGVNAVNEEARQELVAALADCDDQDYFEKGLEMLAKTVRLIPVDVTDCLCIEVDFPDDLVEANKLLTN